MKIKIKINVTQRDIDLANKEKRGIESDYWAATSCPIARAVRRHKKLKRAEVGTNSVDIPNDYLDMGNNTKAILSWGKSIKLPEEAENFVADFDCGFKVKPFSFELEIN